MNMPSAYTHHKEWMLQGPMSSGDASFLSNLPKMAVDGGIAFCPSADIWVGDLDSSPFTPKVKHQFRHPQDKALSDLSLALALFGHLNSVTLHLWGFLGGRKDHELFNLGEILHFLENKERAKVFLYDESSQIKFELFSSGEWDLTHHGTFSLGCLNECLVTLKGECIYQLSSPTLFKPLSSFGLSNKGFGQMKLTNSRACFIYKDFA
jgi:thiamine pyrophosphokinase